MAIQRLITFLSKTDNYTIDIVSHFVTNFDPELKYTFDKYFTVPPPSCKPFNQVRNLQNTYCSAIIDNDKNSSMVNIAKQVNHDSVASLLTLAPLCAL